MNEQRVGAQFSVEKVGKLREHPHHCKVFEQKVFISETFSGNKYTSTCLAASVWCTEHAHDTPFLKMDNVTAPRE